MPRSLMDHLARQYPQASRQTLRRMVEEGRVRINGAAAKSLKQPVEDQDNVEVAARPRKAKASIAPLEIIHEDADILVVHKPAGLLTSTTEREWRPTAIAIIRAYLADHDPKARAGVIHRLDRDASGLLVFSKNNDAYDHLKRQFFEHTVERIYTAVVRGAPKEMSGRIETDLVELTDGTVRPTRIKGKGQRAVTEYQVIAVRKPLAMLRIKLHTGRKHQIRTHLAQKGMPIVGDTRYGNPDDKGRLLLAATKLTLTHPCITGQRLEFEIEPPIEIKDAMRA